MNKLVDCLSNIFLPIASAFLLLFIPLYPKFPLFDIVQTWVYIRLEDFLVGIILGLFVFTAFARRKFSSSPLTIPILVYWAVGLLVLVHSIVFIASQIAHFFPHLAILHYMRRIEYMMLFFITYDSVARFPQRLGAYIKVLSITVALIIAYGIGQKFLGFPAFLTMNEEFAKGAALRLPPTARMTATFGGHYDLAAYLVLVIPIFGALVFGAKRLVAKATFFLLALCSYVVLLFTASRTSFGMYLVAMSIMLYWMKKRLFIIPVIVVSMFLLNFVSGASERFYKTFRYSDVIVDLSTGQPVGTLDKIQGGSAVVKRSESPAEENLPTGSGFINIPGSGPVSAGKSVRNIEVFTAKELATGSGEIATISGSFLIQKALVYDISITTRLQGQWPKAIEAFKRNIYWGSGFSTLSVASDGDYLRMLGETGIVGTVAFLGIFLAMFALFFKRMNQLEVLPKAFVVGAFAGTVGLLCNALLIDVFEASKVAFSYWMLMGIAVALLSRGSKDKISYTGLLFRLFTHPVAWSIYLTSFAFLVYKNGLSGYFVADDFTWLRWAAESTTKDIANYFTQSAGFFYRPIPKLFHFFLYSIFWLKPYYYHVVSVLLLSLITACLYGILRRLKLGNFFAVLFSALFVSLAVHHESVYWVSGLSSLLAGAFLFSSLFFFMLRWERAGRTWVYALLAPILLFASMLSYDGMVVAPIIVFLVGWVVYKRRKPEDFLILLLIGVYWLMRTFAGAIFPSGDYGVNPSKIVVNAAGNGISYMGIMLFGPRAIDIFEQLRSALRGYSKQLSVAGLIVLPMIVFVIYRLRKSLSGWSSQLVWLGVTVVALLAYLGLGGIAERYGLVASGFLVIFLATSARKAWENKGFFVKGLIILSTSALFIWNAMELLRLAADWKVASSASEYTVLTMKKSYFPLSQPRDFVFVNTPIRYGRAWIFATGLTDPLWHMFRFNQYPFTTATLPTIEDGFARPVAEGWYKDVFIFEDGKLKRVEKEQKPEEN